jgi:hypothetical protein
MKWIAGAATLYSLAFVDLVHQASAEDALTAPPRSNLLLNAIADGVQVYVCTETDNGFIWVFDGPSAVLFNAAGRQIGTHEKGPMWTLGDGSAIIGQLVAQKDALEPSLIPWLLLKVKTHLGPFGMLSNVDYVRRIDTKGGSAPPDGCDRPNQGDIARIRYSAVYQFYGP